MRYIKLAALWALLLVQIAVLTVWTVAWLVVGFIWTGRYMALQSALPLIAIMVAVQVTFGLIIEKPATTYELLSTAFWSTVGVYIGMVSHFLWWRRRLK